MAEGKNRSGACVVNSHNEWDPLEEVVVGRLENATEPPHHVSIAGGIPPKLFRLLRFVGGRHYPFRLGMQQAMKELNGFIHILEAEGVTVRRPETARHYKKFFTPHWCSRGFCNACPRDCFLVIGDEIIEAPMSWRCRYFERHTYYPLFREYFAAGARWTSAPKPPLLDSLYDDRYTVPGDGEEMRYVLTESEVVFDAADMVRCGKDLFIIRSNATNRAGIQWLERHLGDRYRIHVIETKCRQPLHIDTTFVPLGPGKVMINPKYIDPARLPAALKSWDLFPAPEPVVIDTDFFGEAAALCSLWLNMNVLMLDEKRVICEKAQAPMVEALRRWGFEPIPCDFQHLNPFGGSFHCLTLDIRRRGTLESYC